jgi:hypothetical protein
MMLLMMTMMMRWETVCHKNGDSNTVYWDLFPSWSFMKFTGFPRSTGFHTIILWLWKTK